eukprot:CAMPEP_0178958040 /NCGR_PEP_ID=MMETSP0789-20121207/11331_1 /TAXON_ID=3005 /ORGANISM="Rhizosolenia setigera, Strain CCMP 1694" /LENGTH=304 /DNA_ID=CAMNT_0020640521 /DNA_START=22 /DNA_END=936 /DNA_ORIENTATION=+
MSSLRRTDLLTLSNLRNDGRKPNEIRRTQIQIGMLNQNSSSNASTGVSGSALIQMGLTVALCTILGPTDCTRRSDENNEKAFLNVSLRISPFAPSTGDRRVYNNPQNDKRLMEQRHMIQKAFEAAVLLHLYPRAKIDVNIIILADDGGRLCAAINACTLAFIDAGIPMKDMVCSCSAGLGGANGDICMVDLNRMERLNIGGGGGGLDTAPYLPCAILPQRDTVVLAQCESRLPISTFENVLNAAIRGCHAMYEVMQAAVRERAGTLLASHEGNAHVLLSSAALSHDVHEKRGKTSEREDEMMEL